MALDETDPPSEQEDAQSEGSFDEPENPGASLIGFGQYEHCSLEEIYEQDRGYLLWAIELQGENARQLEQRYQAYQDWLDKKRAPGSEPLWFGKRRREPFRNIYGTKYLYRCLRSLEEHNTPGNRRTHAELLKLIKRHERHLDEWREKRSSPRRSRAGGPHANPRGQKLGPWDDKEDAPETDDTYMTDDSFVVSDDVFDEEDYDYDDNTNAVASSSRVTLDGPPVEGTSDNEEEYNELEGDELNVEEEEPSDSGRPTTPPFKGKGKKRADSNQPQKQRRLSKREVISISSDADDEENLKLDDSGQSESAPDSQQSVDEESGTESSTKPSPPHQIAKGKGKATALQRKRRKRTPRQKVIDISSDDNGNGSVHLVSERDANDVTAEEQPAIDECSDHDSTIHGDMQSLSPSRGENKAVETPSKRATKRKRVESSEASSEGDADIGKPSPNQSTGSRSGAMNQRDSNNFKTPQRKQSQRVVESEPESEDDTPLDELQVSWQNKGRRSMQDKVFKQWGF